MTLSLLRAGGTILPGGLLEYERLVAVLAHQPLDDALGRQVDGGGAAFVGHPVLAPVPHLVPRGVGLMPALLNRNYFLRFRFRLFKIYGSGSDF
jgi:hypothetical protein